MNKPLLLLTPLAAAALLSGCRVYLPGESPRRTVFVNSSTTVRTDAPAARVGAANAAEPSTPSSDRIAPQPVTSPAPVQVTEPTPVVGVMTGVLLPPGSNPSASSTMVVSPTSLPPTAGADSYLNYMGKGSSSSAPARPAAPAAAPAPAPAAAAAQGPATGGYRIYTVRSGDSAGAIANANGMTLADFAKLNNLSNPNMLRVGQTVKIAAPAAAAPRTAPAPQPVQPQRASAAAAPAGTVVVQDGDTLSAIAARNGTTVKALMEANGLSDANAIRAGKTLRLPGAAASSAAAVQNVVHPIPTTTRPVATIPATTRPPARVTPAEASATPGSTVATGDAVYDAAAIMSGSSLGAARQRAQDTAQGASDRIRGAAQAVGGQAQAVGDQAQSALGQVSDAAGRAADAVRAAASSGTREYVVQEGDDIYSIAMQFDVQPLRIRALNGGKTLDDVKPGDRILVPAN